MDMVEREQEKEAASPVQPLKMDEIRALADRALKVIPERAAHFAPLVGVQYGRITIRNQKTRWGSCSSKGNLNFNCLLMLAPPEVLDYVIVHELCHRKEMNHSPRFWSEVAKVIPDYKKHEKWLKTEGTRLMRRMTG
jgi:predicted metal-dependent hydrolase